MRFMFSRDIDDDEAAVAGASPLVDFAVAGQSHC